MVDSIGYITNGSSAWSGINLRDRMNCELEQHMKTKEFISLEDRFGAKNYNPLDVILSRGEGVWVWDVDGKK